MDKLLKGKACDLSPDVPHYDRVYHLKQLQAKTKENCQKAHLRRLQNYNKKRQDMLLKEKDSIECG